MARLGRRERCRHTPAPFGSSKLNRNASSGIVSLLASIERYIRLPKLTFGRSSRAH
jgi:hypothetical protein